MDLLTETYNKGLDVDTVLYYSIVTFDFLFPLLLVLGHHCTLL